MSKEIYISSTPQETRLAIVEKEELSEIYYERENEYTLAGSIYNGRVTRVLPGMQSAFVDVGLERDAFLYITDFLEEQGEDAAEFEGGEPRSESSDRDRKGERGVDRGGRRPDRNGRGRETVTREPLIENVGPVAPEEPVATAETAGESAERGEEAGDGSRRWRGRRGRRRGGRGGDERPAGVPANETAVPESDVPSEFSAEPMEQIFGQAEAEPVEAPTPDGPRAHREGRDRGGRDRGGRERQGRDRTGDRGRRPERGDEREGAAGRSERGDFGPQAGAEPMILPGESLSRYRRGEGAQDDAESVGLSARAAPSYLTSRPSTEMDLSTAGWDGGFVLPGETLSRRRGQQEPTAPAASEVKQSEEPETEVGASGQGSGRRRDRDRRRGRGTRSETPAAETAGAQAEQDAPSSFRSGAVLHEDLSPEQAAQPGVSSQHEPERQPLDGEESLMAAAGTSDDVPAFEMEAFEARREAETTVAEDVTYEPETDMAPAAEGPGNAVLAAVEALHKGLAHTAEGRIEFQEETAEYEPDEEASASYRVDPAGPSEFRQSGLVQDELDSVQVRFDEGSAAAQQDPDHQFTAVQSTGEMLSELPGEIAVPGAEEDPTNPIESETAILSGRLSEVEGELETAQPAEAGAHQTFEPGDGPLEEELMDEDESEVFDLAASYGDDTEEETFDAAQVGAQIGSLMRDRALDEMTGAGGTVLDEEEDDEDEDGFDIDEEEMEEDELDGEEEIAAGDVAEGEEDELSEANETVFEDEGEKPAAALMGEFPEFAEERSPRDSGRAEATERSGEGRREPRRGEGRDGGRDRGDRGGRDRGSRDRRGMAGSRSGGRQSRHSMQTTDLPAISDLLKPGQEVLVQIAKEPIAKKGARITSHIALPGRFLVFMPTVNHVGVSRKIESDGERRRLKEILLSEKGEASGGFIVRTAASGASEEELRSDLRFLLNLWADIKQRSEGSKSPALIYHDLNLVERVLRDQVSENFSAIWCDTETEYERVLRFLQRFEPSLMRRVKLYTKETPLFEQFGISEEINKALRSKVWLKSGGSIVINQTEALVAIDINTGKYVGKTARLEDTIVKTNLDAIPEIVRQIRLRDLGGIIVIDFIDMDDRKNRQKVLLALEEELKKDRAPSKVLQFNDFGLVAITRKRVKQSLERTLSTTCGICAGTGMVKAPVTVCNEIYVELRKMHKQLDKGDVMLRVNPEVVKQLKANNAKWLQEMEEVSGKTILVKSDPSLHPEQFDIH